MREPIESFRYFTRILTRFEEELRPVTADRKDKASFCYNSGRIIADIGPFVVGRIASMGVDALATAMQVLFWVRAVPLAGLLLMPWVIETKHRVLTD
jgi:hypothetical protein